MISQKFSNISNGTIADYISESKTDVASVLDSVDSVSDLWVLANMKDTFDEENNLHSSNADSDTEMLPLD